MTDLFHELRVADLQLFYFLDRETVLQPRHNFLLKIDNLRILVIPKEVCHSAKQVSVDFVAAHHLLLLGKLAHQLCHVFQGHIRRVSLGCVNDCLDLAVNIVEGLKEMHISQLDPQLILIVQEDGLVLDFDMTIDVETILHIAYISLIEEVMHNRRD